MAKKRANGEGNIRKRKDGRWEGRYTAGYDEKTGKRLIKNVLGKTQAEVKEKLAKAVAEAETVDVRRADEYTLGTWLQTWYKLYAKPHLRFSTAEYYRRGKNLHPRHTPDAGKCRRKDGQIHGAGHVKTKRAVERMRRSSSPPLSEHFRVWVTVWVRRFRRPKIRTNKRENQRKSYDFRWFLELVAGLEPATC